MTKGYAVRNKLFELVKRKEADLGRTIPYSELADELGVSINTITNWMRREPGRYDAEILVSAKRYFNLKSVSELIEFEESEENK